MSCSWRRRFTGLTLLVLSKKFIAFLLQIGLIWNERDESVDWVKALSHAMQWDTRMPYEVGTDFSDVIAAGPFGDVERVTFVHSQSLTRDGLRQRVMSTSYVSAMEEENLELLMSAVDEVIDQLAEPIVLPYVTTAYSARAVLRAT
jgi:hypothetical protein